MQTAKIISGLALSLTIVSLAGLGGCRTTKEVLAIGEAAEANPGPCPRAFSIYDAQRIVEFKGQESFANVGFTGEMGQVRSLCRYYGTEPIIADLDIDMAFGRGPAATGNVGQYRYFVAVTRKNLVVIDKQYFDLNIKFPEGSDYVSKVEHIDKIVIPRADENISGANFEIIVGFDVTPAQREFNAAGKRFRVSAGKN